MILSKGEQRLMLDPDELINYELCFPGAVHQLRITS
jgi:hypothetical protein